MNSVYYCNAYADIMSIYESNTFKTYMSKRITFYVAKYKFKNLPFQGSIINNMVFVKMYLIFHREPKTLLFIYFFGYACKLMCNSTNLF